MTCNTYFGFLAAVILSALIVTLVATAPGVSADGDDDVDILSEKSELQYPSLGSHLNQMVSNVQEGRMAAREAAEGASVYSGESVAVTIHLSGHVDEVVTFLANNGGDPRNVGEDYIEAYVPVSLLGPVSEQPGVVRVREIVPPQPTQLSQQVIGDGPPLHGSQAWNAAGYSGQGVKVGVIDLSFRGVTTLMGTELPADIVARCYSDVGMFTNNLDDCEPSGETPIPLPGCPPRTPSPGGHGTIVAESLLDMAPGVTLYVADPYSRGDLLETVEWMASEGVQVVNYSVGYTYDGPGDGTSPLSLSPLNTVDRAVENNILWVNSAGNSGRDTWFGGYSDSDGDRQLDFGGSIEEVIELPIYECERHVIQLRWEDSWTAARTDLDLHLYNKVTNEIVFSSDDPQSGAAGQVPWEAFALSIPFRSNAYGIKVTHYSGEVPDWIQVTGWTVFPIEPHTLNGSITNPAESSNPGLLAVGAAPWYDVQSIERYSSRGPTPDGRTKPGIVGVDCGETALRTYRPGTNRGFCGTSQSAPHVSGMAALVRQRFPELTAEQVASYLKLRAEGRGTVPNNTWGYGFAQLPAADVLPEAELPRIPGTLDGCGETVTDDGPVSGTWLSGCQSSIAERGNARYYSFSLDEEREVTIYLESSVDTYLYLRSGDARSGAILNENDDVEPGSEMNSQITETLSAGTYTIEATTYSTGETGMFALTINGLLGTTTDPGAGDTCGETISGDGPTTGTWSAACRSSVEDRGYARYYTFTLEQQSQITIELTSSVDTYLYLRSGNARTGAVLYENDDIESGGVNLNSRISETLVGGSYTIEATTYDNRQAGTFTLTISRLAGGNPEEPGTELEPGTGQSCVDPITVNGPTTGTWSAECRSSVEDRGYARYYTLTLEHQSQVTIELTSSVDTYLYLRSGDSRTGAVLYENDDIEGGGVNLNSRISETLSVGAYTIEATTYNNGQAGTFTQTISGLDSVTMEQRASCGEIITGHGTTTGTWASGCQSSVAGRGYARYYTFTLEQQSQVNLELTSSVDTYLYLRSGNARSGAILSENDDIESGGVNLNSRMSETLSAGAYTIEATTYDPEVTGAFTLTYELEDG